MLRTITAVASLAFILSACGGNTLDRGLSGAGIGAGLGAATGAASGGGLTSGAILGAAAGATTGVLTNSDQINLGRPIWRR
jgi:osmotically inducible lipoprotein OsmB